jgi:TRAP-type mannitol/chloroaromatic compound transport system permease small subunit
MLGRLCSLLLLLLVTALLVQVGLRYGFSWSPLWLQEVGWHIFGLLIFLSISYTLKQNGHVRVEFFYEKMSEKVQDRLFIFGMLACLWPMAFCLMYFGYQFAAQSYGFAETSGDPGGLAFRWVIKGSVPLSFFVLFCQSLRVLYKIGNSRRA